MRHHSQNTAPAVVARAASVTHPASRMKDPLDGGHDHTRIGQPPGPLVAPRQPADFGLADVHAALAEHLEVVLHRRVLPHLGVHGRGQ